MNLQTHDAYRKTFPRKSLLLILFFLAAGLWMLIEPGKCWSLDAREIIVIANRNVPDSKALAFYYMTRRGIPAENLLVLALTDEEHCSRKEYDQEVVIPVRRFLQAKDPENRKFRCIVTMHGVPLVVNGSGLNIKDTAKIAALRERIKVIRSELAKQPLGGKEKDKAYKEKIEPLERQITAISKADSSASFDSELALVRETAYSLAGWVPNPYYLGYRGRPIKNMPSKAFLVARLDGPSKKIVSRIIDDSLAAEARGLHGTAYFDARWPDPGKKQLSGYAFYDQSLHLAARHIKEHAVMPVTLDEKERLFQPGEAPNAALYCGWYSLGKYVDAFAWVPGAVGYHIASEECETLRKPGSRVWCKAMLEKGVAATIGPVSEPYVQAFPIPEVFFTFLISGRLTLAECYALSNPFLSWKMVLIGDPLYRPFKYRVNAETPGPRRP
jgi:uncharacterized protein (TIGR03790 family)